MTYVITRLCTNDGACVDVCPVACIHTRPGASQFYIDPDVCIDCEQCEIVCPVDAIFKDVDVPGEHADAIDLNASFFRQNKAVVGPVALETAWQMVHRAHAYARSVGIAVTATVVDEAGAPIAVGRMDGAAPWTAELAVNKAYTAAAFHLATADVAAQARQPWAPARRGGRSRHFRRHRDHRRHRRRWREYDRARRAVLPGRPGGPGGRAAAVMSIRGCYPHPGARRSTGGLA